MSIISKDKGLVNNNPLYGKAQDNSPSNDKLLAKGENPDGILFFRKEKTKNIPLNSSVIISDIEKKYLAFSEFIYNNPNGHGYFQISIESIYPRIIIKHQTDPLFIQNTMDFGFVDQIFLSSDCREIINDTLCKQTGSHNCYAKFFSISPKYIEDKGEYIKAFHLITINVINEGIRIQINDNKPKRYGQLNTQ